MSNTEAIDQLTDVLRETKIFTLDPSRRRQIAETLHASGITPRHVRTVWQEAKTTCGSQDPAGLFATVVQNASRLLEVFRDTEARETRKSTRSGQQAASGLDWATAENPYGWREQAIHQRQDHSIPGEWNAYRQCYNLTHQQAGDLLLREVRLHGCARIEVLGDYDKDRIKQEKARKPTPHWDAGLVEMLKNPVAVPAISSASAVGERDVYGA